MTGQMKNFDGIPILEPKNDITSSKDNFYISYNNRDTQIYGCDTTALVLESPIATRFLILNGNHTKEYNEIINDVGSYENCVEYFNQNMNLKSKFSENSDEFLILKDGKLVKVKEKDSVILFARSSRSTVL